MTNCSKCTPCIWMHAAMTAVHETSVVDAWCLAQYAQHTRKDRASNRCLVAVDTDSRRMLSDTSVAISNDSYTLVVWCVVVCGGVLWCAPCRPFSRVGAHFRHNVSPPPRSLSYSVSCQLVSQSRSGAPDSFRCSE